MKGIVQILLDMAEILFLFLVPDLLQKCDVFVEVSEQLCSSFAI